MYKFAYLLVALLFTYSNVSAQIKLVNHKGTRISIDTSKWALSGLDVFNKNTGNVGVGNPTPAYKLDVTGKTRVTDSFVANSARVINLSSGSTNDSIVVADATTGVLKRVTNKIKPTVIKTTSTQSTSSTTLTNVNTLTFTAQSGKNYRVRLWLVYNSSATGNGIRIGPNTFSGGEIWYNIAVDNSTTGTQQLSSYNTNTALNSTGSRATTDNVALIQLDLECTTTSALSFRFGSESSGSTITIQPDSRLEYEITN